ncbi:uncharacterized protein QYS62_001569 [Fusarium acuminatum]|uniref:Uncharacterized protein n=1 Tax=Fusarium acuminatum TaxID=5515 RepID=A0ABZ2WJD4_9HYPO
MLRRNSSRKKNRRPLSRSKSTNSVVRSPIRNLESIDPVRAERDANIAAVVSYNRAQDRPISEGMSIPRDPASFYPENSDGTGSVIRHSPERNGSALSRHGNPNIARNQSVRFTGPSALPRRTLASRANGGRDSPTKATSAIHAFGHAKTRPSTALSFHQERPDNFSLTRRYLESLQPPDACYNPEDDAVSMPTSFKKVRKSRSMLTSPHPAIGAFSNKNGSAKDCPPPAPSANSRTNDENDAFRGTRLPTSSLRASTSMSYLKSRRKTVASRSSSRAEDNELAVQLARERFRQIQEEDERKAQSSELLQSKNRQNEVHAGLRKSLRNSSNNSTALSSTFSTTSISVSKQRGIRRTARKVSHGLRSKIRGLFSRGKNDEDSEQQEYEQGAAEKDSDGDSCLQLGDVEATEEASMFRVTSHVPSLHDIPSNQQLRSRKGSVESFADNEQHVLDDKSRVTSWTNSMSNTVTSHGTFGDWERQRLSVIKENGTHIPSSLRSIEPLEQQTREMIADMSIDNKSCHLPQKVSLPVHEHPTGWDWSDDRADSENDRTSVLLSGLELPRTMSQRSSAFFASPSCHSFRSPSPYRRALQASMKNSSEDDQDGLPGSQYLHSLSALSLPARQNSNSCSEKDFHAADTESVYSSVADDAKPTSAATESGTWGQSTAHAYTGPGPSDAPVYKLEQHHQRDTSTASSVEWKTWLSSKVSKLEAPLTPTKGERRQGSGVLPLLGHVRENASMGSTPELAASTNDGLSNRSPLSRVKGNAQTFQDGHSHSNSIRQVVIGYDENMSPNNKPSIYAKERPPSIPPRSTLRAVPSLPIVGSRGHMMDVEPVKEMQRMRSLNMIGRFNSTSEECITKRRSRARLSGWQGSPIKSSPGISSFAKG